jgi:xylulokinase
MTAPLAGIDLGTTGVKVVLVDPATGETVAQAYRDYPSDTRTAGHHEQDPADWWTATVAVLRSVDAASVTAVGLSGHMHAVTLTDHKGFPVRPAMTWADRRSTAEVEYLRRAGLFGELTANPVVEAFSAPKLAWLAAHEPASLSRAARLVQPKDFLRHRLTGEWGTDVTDAAGTLLYDVRAGDWDPRLWELAGADARLALTVSGSADVIGSVTRAAAAETGLPAGTPVVAGGGDVSCAALGAGVVADGHVYVNVGTAAQIVTPLPALPPASPDRFVFARAGEPGFLAMVSCYAAGLAIRWSERTLLGGGADLLASGSEPGARGLTFVPYLLGASAPTHDPHVRAALFWAGPEHGPPDVARATIEGVAYECAAAVGQATAAVTGIRAGGGVTRSAIWREAFAAVCDAPVRLLRDDASPRGAVALAGVGTKVWPDVATAASVLDDSLPLVAARTTAYREARRRFDRAAAALSCARIEP